MTLTLKPWHAVLAIVCFVLFALAHSSIAPFSNNHFHAHRWRTEACVKNNLPIAVCTVKIPAVTGISTEEAQFDICLEHGEWRRIK